MVALLRDGVRQQPVCAHEVAGTSGHCAEDYVAYDDMEVLIEDGRG